MKRNSRRIFTAGLTLLLSTASLLAHHSAAATYDTSKPITLKGTVTKLEWMNPHVYYYIEVKDSDGSVTTWGIETSTPNSLYRAGWRKTDLKIGDIVTVQGASPARNGSNKAYGGTVFLPYGRKIFSGSAATDR